MYAPIFHRLVDNIRILCVKGWLPPEARYDPVLWTKRENNKLADHICNVTMDSKQSWRKHRQVDLPAHARVIAFSDGGTRLDCSAIGWAVGFVRADGCFVPAIIEGVFLESPVNSFLAEAMALENATLEVRKFISSL
eukprot:11846863-Karenia_brevis.AAC.1